MWPLLVTLLLLQAVFFKPVYSRHTDSLAESINSTSEKTRQAPQNLDRKQDSAKQIVLRRQTVPNSRSLEQFLVDMKEGERREIRQLYIRIGLGSAFIIALIYGIARKRKKGNRVT